MTFIQALPDDNRKCSRDFIVGLTELLIGFITLLFIIWAAQIKVGFEKVLGAFDVEVAEHEIAGKQVPRNQLIILFSTERRSIC